MVAAGVICAFALVPGLPKIPFLLIGGALAAVAYALKDGMPQPRAAEVVPGARLGQLGPGGVPELPAAGGTGDPRPRSTRSSWRSASASCRWSKRARAAA